MRSLHPYTMVLSWRCSALDLPWFLFQSHARALDQQTTNLECVLGMDGGEVRRHTTFVPAHGSQGEIEYIVALNGGPN